MGERRCEGLAWHQYVGMHVHVVPNRGSSPTVLLRESYREGAKVAKRTLANLSSLSAAQIEAIRAALRGEALQPLAQSFEITQSRSYGHATGRATGRGGRGGRGIAVGAPIAERPPHRSEHARFTHSAPTSGG